MSKDFSGIVCGLLSFSWRYLEYNHLLCCVVQRGFRFRDVYKLRGVVLHYRYVCHTVELVYKNAQKLRTDPIPYYAIPHCTKLMYENAKMCLYSELPYLSSVFLFNIESCSKKAFSHLLIQILYLNQK